MRVFLTGSSGYIGQRVVKLFSENPEIEEIVGLDLSPPPEDYPKFRHVQGDVTQPFDEHLEGVDIAVHLAFIVDPMRDERLQERINLGGTANFLEAVRQHRVKDVVVFTSATAYGAHADNPEFMKESDPLRGNCSYPYSRDKLRQEALVNGLREEGMRVKVLRPVVVFGPNVENFISRYLLKPVVVTAIGGSTRFQVVHEDDVARAVTHLAQHPGQGAYNLSADGLMETAVAARKAGRRIITLPKWFLYVMVWLGWKLGIKALTETPTGLLDFLINPWQVDNRRLKEEAGFVYNYDAEATYEDFLRGKNLL